MSVFPSSGYGQQQNGNMLQVILNALGAQNSFGGGGSGGWPTFGGGFQGASQTPGWGQQYPFMNNPGLSSILQAIMGGQQQQVPGRQTSFPPGSQMGAITGPGIYGGPSYGGPISPAPPGLRSPGPIGTGQPLVPATPTGPGQAAAVPPWPKKFNTNITGPYHYGGPTPFPFPTSNLPFPA